MRWPSDDFSYDSPGPTVRPKGLHYLEPPEVIPVYAAYEPGPVPQVLTPPLPDGDLPSWLTGSVHGGWRLSRSADAGR